ANARTAAGWGRWERRRRAARAGEPAGAFGACRRRPAPPGGRGRNALFGPGSGGSGKRAPDRRAGGALRRVRQRKECAMWKRDMDRWWVRRAAGAVLVGLAGASAGGAATAGDCSWTLGHVTTGY